MQDKREQEVLKAARMVFWKRGYQATSFQDLTAAGLSRRAVYSRFESKEGLFEAVLTEYRSEYRAIMEGALSGADAEGVIRFLEALRELARSDFDGRGCMVANAANELAPMHPGMNTHFNEHFGGLHDLMKSAFRRSSDSLTIDPDTLASSVLCSVLGVLLVARGGNQELAAAGIDGIIAQIRAALS